MSTPETVEVSSTGESRTIVGGDGSPWWMRYAMQAGFLFVLCAVLWGIHDIITKRLPTLSLPVEKVADVAVEVEKHLEKSAEAAEKQAQATERLTLAAEKQATAAATQAKAIERWVDLQDFRRLTQTPMTAHSERSTHLDED